MTNTSYGYIIDPNDSTKRIDGVRLVIIDSKVTIEIPKKIHTLKFEILNGFFPNHNNVTFVGCSFYQLTSGAGRSEGVTKYKVEYMLSGICIKSLDELKFSKAFVNIPSLADFYGSTLINLSHTDDEMIVRIQEPQEIGITDIDNFSLSLSIGNKIYGEPGALNIQEVCDLKIAVTDNTILLHDFFKIIERFQSFLLLVLNYSPNITEIVFYRDDHFSFYGEEKSFIPIQLTTNFHNMDYKNNLIIGELKYSDVENELSKMLFHWYNNKNLHISIDLITEKVYNKDLSRENYFLNSCFAIEIFHRRIVGGTEYPDDVFKEKLEIICNSIEDEKFVSLVNNRLQFANEYSFRKRLKDFKEDFAKILPETCEIKGFISKIVDTRNYLVHRGSDGNTFKEIDLYYASKYIESILIINCLKIINCPDWMINKSFTCTKNSLEQLYNLNNFLQTKICEKS